MGTKTGELRETLIEAINAVRNGTMKPEQAKAIAMLAGQVNLSLQVEVNMLREKLTLDGVGSTSLGETVRALPPPLSSETIDMQPRLVKGRAQSGSK